MKEVWLNALTGGLFLGLATSLMLVLNGRVTGISSILFGSFVAPKSDVAWRIVFILGLICGGLIFDWDSLQTAEFTLQTSNFNLVVAGLLVGFGTLLGSGCTCGHGICGISRFSKRSLLATALFILAGMLTVLLATQGG